MSRHVLWLAALSGALAASVYEVTIGAVTGDAFRLAWGAFWTGVSLMALVTEITDP